MKLTFLGNFSSYLDIWYFSHCFSLWQGIGTSVHFFEVKKSTMHITLDRIKITSVRFVPITKHQSSILNLRVERSIINLCLLLSMPISTIPNPHCFLCICLLICPFICLHIVQQTQLLSVHYDGIWISIGIYIFLINYDLIFLNHFYISSVLYLIW